MELVSAGGIRNELRSIERGANRKQNCINCSSANHCRWWFLSTSDLSCAASTNWIRNSKSGENWNRQCVDLVTDACDTHKVLTAFLNAFEGTDDNRMGLIELRHRQPIDFLLPTVVLNWIKCFDQSIAGLYCITHSLRRGHRFHFILFAPPLTLSCIHSERYGAESANWQLPANRRPLQTFEHLQKTRKNHNRLETGCIHATVNEMRSDIT